VGTPLEPVELRPLPAVSGQGGGLEAGSPVPEGRVVHRCSAPCWPDKRIVRTAIVPGRRGPSSPRRPPSSRCMRELGMRRRSADRLIRPTPLRSTIKIKPPLCRGSYPLPPYGRRTCAPLNERVRESGEPRSIYESNRHIFSTPSRYMLLKYARAAHSYLQ